MDCSRPIDYLRIDKNLSVGQNFREEHMRFWDSLYDKYGNKPYVVY
ncbi:hypothetical protein NQ314_019924 [Rhamnusium bicolor]|uniref:Uncharacterized protein n=1 Tax=Rhamnusium bicolor TaxID=1586634 RepID=A0AAV8WMU3_9CUCU|nr:hypothetical protein NQ314_019924 [Rhamnusium bicolor]